MIFSRISLRIGGGHPHLLESTVRHGCYVRNHASCVFSHFHVYRLHALRWKVAQGVNSPRVMRSSLVFSFKHRALSKVMHSLLGVVYYSQWFVCALLSRQILGFEFRNAVAFCTSFFCSVPLFYFYFLQVVCCWCSCGYYINFFIRIRAENFALSCIRKQQITGMYRVATALVLAHIRMLCYVIDVSSDVYQMR